MYSINIISCFLGLKYELYRCHLVLNVNEEVKYFESLFISILNFLAICWTLLSVLLNLLLGIFCFVLFTGIWSILNYNIMKMRTRQILLRLFYFKNQPHKKYD